MAFQDSGSKKLIKTFFIGASGVGKSQIFSRVRDDQYKSIIQSYYRASKDYDDFVVKPYQLGTEKFQVKFFDRFYNKFSAFPDYNLRRNDTDIVFIVIDSLEPLEQIDEFIKEDEKKEYFWNAKRVILVNKMDLLDDGGRPALQKLVQDRATELCMPCYFISAKTGEGVFPAISLSIEEFKRPYIEKEKAFVALVGRIYDELYANSAKKKLKGAFAFFSSASSGGSLFAEKKLKTRAEIISYINSQSTNCRAKQAYVEAIRREAIPLNGQTAVLLQLIPEKMAAIEALSQQCDEENVLYYNLKIVKNDSECLQRIETIVCEAERQKKEMDSLFRAPQISQNDALVVECGNLFARIERVLTLAGKLQKKYEECIQNRGHIGTISQLQRANLLVNPSSSGRLTDISVDLDHDHVDEAKEDREAPKPESPPKKQRAEGAASQPASQRPVGKKKEVEHVELVEMKTEKGRGPSSR